MQPAESYSKTSPWLLDGGLRQVELLLRAVVYPPAEPILITDDERNCRDTCCGTGKLLGLSRDRIIGRKIDEFLEPGSRAQIAEDWQAFLQKGERPGRVRMVGADGTVQDVEFTAKGNVLPGRHALALRAKKSRVRPAAPGSGQDFAVYLFDADGRIVSWYGGAERVYGYKASEIVGQAVSRLCKDSQLGRLDEELKRAAAQGHFGIERWHIRKDGTRFWANVLTMALRSDEGEFQGFARVVRDFSARHSADEKLLPGGVLPISSRPLESTIAGVVSGEFDHILEANDAFLQMVGYSREDLAAGQLYWPSLTPAEYSHLDELAHEEALRYGACTPFEKEYVRKDGTRVNVLVTFAVLNLSPFHWMAIVHVSSGAMMQKLGISRKDI